MSISTPAITNFTAGELSPRLDGRVDLSKYFNGCKTLENFHIHPHGGATRRPGFRFIGEVKDSSQATLLIPFEFNAAQTYVLEFGDCYMRVFHGRGRVLDGDNAIYEIKTTYKADELRDLRYAQSAETMYIVHPDHAPAKLQRVGHNDWTLADVAWTNAPDGWAKGNYPTVVGFYQQRLVIGATPDEPGTIWFSKSGGLFDTLTTGTDDDMGMKFTLDSENMDGIVGLVLGKSLLVVLTQGAEWTIGAGSYSTTVLTPTNVKADIWTTIGSNDVRPVRTANAILFFNLSGKKLHEFAYVYTNDEYAAPDLTLLSEHLGRGHAFIDSAFAKDPDSVLYCVRDDGVLCGLTYARDNEVVGWHRIITDGAFESVATIHGADRTELWAVVKRQINGEQKRYIELMEAPFNGEIEDAFFLDSGLTYAGEAVDIITGADHLEGRTVDILADGAVHPPKVVTGGTIHLDRPASNVHIGLPYTSTLQPMRLEGGSQRGTSQTKAKRFTKVAVRFFETLGGRIGPDENNLETVYFRTPSTPMGQSSGAWTGDKIVNFPKGWNQDGLLTIKQEQPLPMTVLMVVPHQVINV